MKETPNAGFKFRLYPNKEQAKQFDKNIGCCRWIYNWALGLKKNAYEADKKRKHGSHERPSV